MATCVIPKIIHQTYSSKSKLPNAFVKWSDTIKKYYKDFQYKFYSDRDIDKWMSKFDADFKQKVFDRLPIKIMKIDVFRYRLMWHIGGVYFDMDYEALKRFPFDTYTKPVIPMNRSIEEGDAIDEVGNSVIASPPKHPFWKHVGEMLEKSISVIKTKYAHLDPKEKSSIVLEHTGPNFLWNAIQTFNNKKDIVLLPRTLFHPKINNNHIDEKTYGRHHCAGTWRKK